MSDDSFFQRTNKKGRSAAPIGEYEQKSELNKVDSKDTSNKTSPPGLHSRDIQPPSPLKHLETNHPKSPPCTLRPNTPIPSRTRPLDPTPCNLTLNIDPKRAHTKGTCSTDTLHKHTRSATCANEPTMSPAKMNPPFHNSASSNSFPGRQAKAERPGPCVEFAKLREG